MSGFDRMLAGDRARFLRALRWAELGRPDRIARIGVEEVGDSLELSFISTGDGKTNQTTRFDQLSDALAWLDGVAWAWIEAKNTP